MNETISILFVSANPWTTSRILVDEEAREIFEKLQEGPHRERFILHKHAAIRPADIQRLLMMYRPQIVHFSGHSSKKQKLILGGVPGRGKQINRRALVNVFALYPHVRLVFLNACFTRTQARSLSEVIDYSIGSRKPIGDRESVTFAGAFYRALGFGRSIREAFDSARAELALANMTRAQGLELFIRKGVDESDWFPQSLSFENQLAETSRRAYQPLSPETDAQYAAGLPAGNLDEATLWTAIQLLRKSIVVPNDEAIQREQFTVSCEYARQEYSPGPIAITCNTSAVTIDHRVLRLTQPSAPRRVREDRNVRGVGANKKRQRHSRRSPRTLD
jgi:hypothetical protein